MVSEEGDGDALPIDIKAEAVDFPVEQSSDAPFQASAENASLAGLSFKISDPSKPREAFNREMYRIPSYSGWFSWGKIHAIERRALPEFFDGFSLSKSPKVYKEYREFVINKYRENPKRVLTFTEVRKMLVGDVNLLRKVFDFLEYWGLINYHITSENKQQQMKSTGEHSPAIMANSNETNEMAAENIETQMPENNVSAMSEPVTQCVQDSITDLSQGEQLAITPISQPMNVSPEEKLPSHKDEASPSVITSSIDGVRHPQNLTKDNDWLGNWSMEEVLCLLEGIKNFGEDWNRVAAHVGTKSRLDCVLRFIKLSFGDQFSSNMGISPYQTARRAQDVNGNKGNGDKQKESDSNTSPLHWNSHENVASDEVINEPPSKQSRLSPLADSSNPILAQVAFLSGIVGPRVAITAAQAAVAALAEEDPVVYQTLQTGANAHSGQPGVKEGGALIGSRATSVKAEDAEAEDLPSGKGSRTQAAKDVDVVGIHSRAVLNNLGGVTNMKLAADQEERDVEHAIASILEDQLRKLQSKVEHYEELEFILEKEHLQLEKARLQVLGDWIRYSQYHYNAGPS